MAISAHPVTEPIAHHGEGPAWHPRWGGLRWVGETWQDSSVRMNEGGH